MLKQIGIVGLVGSLVLLGAILTVDNVDRTPWGESTFRGHSIIVGGRRLLDDAQTRATLKSQYDQTKWDSLKDLLKASSN
jgi:hypothetical protein